MLTTKSIRLTEEELADLHQCLEVTGDIEAVALERAALLGHSRAQVDRSHSRVPQRTRQRTRCTHCWNPARSVLADPRRKGISILEGPSSLASEMEGLARWFQDGRSGRAAEAEPPGT